MIKEIIIRFILFIKWIFYSIRNKFIEYDECIINNMGQNKNITYLFNLINIIRYFHFKLCSKSLLIRVYKNNRYYVKTYKGDEYINNIIKDIEAVENKWNNHKIMSMNINNKDVNIRKYDGNCLISDIVKLEIGECDDCDIKYMNDDFDLCTNRLNSINSKKINELS